jgi:ornithine cyclodeaminase
MWRRSPMLVTRKQIEAVLPSLDLIPLIEEGFVQYSAGNVVVPPVGELLFDRGDVHIKYGYVKGGEHYVIKIASGFHDNPALGLPSGNGVMLVFRQKTGELAGVLLDEGHLTDVRTAVAGAIAAKHLAPSEVARIGVVGSGMQARLQLRHLASVTTCREVLVAGRHEDEEALALYREEMQGEGWQVAATTGFADVLQTCDLVVTATPATQPLLHSADLREGTHITAVGSDTADKQEIDSEILGRADVVVADSESQCLERGEIHKAIESGAITREKLVELGDVIAGRAPGRTSDSQITVADLTGVAVQDIQIATAVYGLTAA